MSGDSDEFKILERNAELLEKVPRNDGLFFQKPTTSEPSYFASSSEILEEAKVPKERNKEVVRFLPLIKKVINRLMYRFPSLVEPEDMVTVGVFGLIEALERYKPGSLPFSQFAEIRIRGAILDEMRRADLFSRGMRKKAKEYKSHVKKLQNRHGRPPNTEEIADSMQLKPSEIEDIRNQVQPVVFMEFEKLDAVSSHAHWPSAQSQRLRTDPHMQIQKKETNQKLRDTIEKLPERHRLILGLYYYEELTLREIGELLELSESRVCQIHRKACLKVRELLKIQGIDFID